MEQDQYAYYNDLSFKNNYSLHHPDDTTLVCQNNSLFYNGEDKVISGNITVKQNERVYLDTFKIMNMNPDQWKMEPYQIFFYIRESVKIIGIDVKENIMSVYKVASKSYLEETDKFSLDYFVDYYNALKSIESHLTGDLFDTLKFIKEMLTNISSMDTNNITPGLKIIYEKLFGEIKNNAQNESPGNSMGNAKTRSNLPSGAHYSDPSINSVDYKSAAFISCVVLVILILAIVIGTVTYIFS